MKRKAIIFIIGFIILLSFILSYQKETKNIIYIMDTESNVISQIGDRKFIIAHIEWSNDNQKFMVINEKSNSIKPPYFDSIMLCSIPDYKITVLPNDNVTKFTYRDIAAGFINNNGILLNRYNTKDQHLFEILNISSGNRIEIAYKDIDKYYNADYDKASKEWNMYEIPEQVAAKLIKAAESEYFEAIINYDGDTAIYRTKGHKVYSIDLNSGFVKFLFKGFYVKWSPSGTKLTYLTHKSKSFEELDDYDDGGLSEDLITYVYDFSTGKSTKVADFGTMVHFSNDDRYIVFYEHGYLGVRGKM